MSKIFNSKPARFPNNNTEEYNSVIKLLDILDKSRIKPDPKLIDKFPNTDGEFTIVDESDYPIGKCELQIKTLPDHNIISPKYQCTLPFLSHCENSLLPVILIAVNYNNEKAYWMHFYRKDLIEINSRLKGESIVVNFPILNVISRTDKSYVDRWTEILNTYIQKKFDYENLLERYKELEILQKTIGKMEKPFHSISSDDLHCLNLFIDTLNNNLDNAFSSIKEILYHGYWKLSIVYSKFENTKLSYAIVPIKYGDNNLLIKETKSLTAKYSSDVVKLITNYNFENPIKNNPIESALLLIKKDTLEVIKKRNIRLVNIPLSQEYIIDFFDKFYQVFPEINLDSVEIIELVKLLNLYLPIWIEEYQKSENESFDEPVLFDIETMLWHTFNEDLEKITVTAIERYKQEEFSKIEITYAKHDYDVVRIRESLVFLYNQGINFIERPYPARVYKECSFAWELYSPESAFIKLKFVYKQLFKTYDQFIEAFFPNIFKELNYFSTFDLQIIDLIYDDDQIQRRGSPGIHIYNLKIIKGKTKPKIEFYLNSKGCPLSYTDHFLDKKKTIEVDGKVYKLISGSSSSMSYFFEKHALTKSLYELLNDKFEEYFKKISTVKK
nr:hypothetical protein [uncultured Flavobacterium sp.]